MTIGDTIEERSEAELAHILSYLADRSRGDRPPVLVGGWAVFSYNPYQKSQDIDLVLSSSHRSSLLYWLRTERGYETRDPMAHGWRGAVKRIPELDDRIVVDVGGFDEEYPLEGRSERLDFQEAIEHSAQHEVAGSRIRVPTRSLLLLYKAKAAWDRSHRLDRETSSDPERDRQKLTKDRTDILALADPSLTAPWDLGYLQEKLEELPVLVEVLQEVDRSEDAVQRYASGRGREHDGVRRLLRQADVLS